MPMTDYSQGSLICKEGEPLQHISFITKGRAEVKINGRSFPLEQGDIIGLPDLINGIYSTSYTAITDITIFSHPYNGLDAFKSLLRDNPDSAQFTVNSVCRQVTHLLEYRSALKKEADSIYGLIMDMFPQYEVLCTRYALSSKKLPELANITPPGQSDPLEDWVHDYYIEIRDMEAELRKGFFYRKPGISIGFFHRGIEDILQIHSAIDVYQEYLEDITKILLDTSGHDLFALISELHFDAINIKDADATVYALINKLLGLLSTLTYLDQPYFKERIEAYNKILKEKRDSQVITDAPSSTTVKKNLSDSLSVILQYSELPEEISNKFAHMVREYTRISDKTSSEDTVYKLRKDLTQIFYEVYTSIFIKSLKDPATPTVIKMFLNFAYIDADLAGHHNADYLFGIADSLKGDKELGLYTLVEWLTAIYNGQKEPSRDDFDMDYTAYIREKRQAGKIDTKEEARLLTDVEAKLRFELENVIPIVNKVTFGRISTFCPLFSEHNVQRELDFSMVTPAALRETFDQIRKIDFSAYFREISYSDTEIGIPREYVHMEIMPEIILMPNVGNRGAMWQEMEGRNRRTPPRVFVPLFLLNDLKTLVIRLTGEYRWELIKRIQGPRWGDLSDPTLTSEYFNYLQFYRSNRDLSMEVKTTIKTELIRARNNYKTVFVNNYVEWILYESNGSPRLNKFARRILTEYCPFTAEIREKLSTNPQYADLLKRYDVKIMQKEKHLSNVFQKITTAGKQIPKELLEEVEYLKR